jgi:hypothetical protein
MQQLHLRLQGVKLMNISSKLFCCSFFCFTTLQTCQRLAAAGLFALLAACGGGGDSTGPAVETAPPTATSAFTVTQFNPANGSVEVSQDTALSVEFSSEVDPASVTTDTVVLTGPQGSIEGRPVANGKQVRFEPNEGLNFSTQYTLQVKEGLKAKDGAALGAGSSTAFTLKQGTWSTPAIVDTGATGSASQLKTVKSANGAMFSVWLAKDGTRNNAWASRFDAATQKWATPTLIEQTDLNIYSIDIAADSQGNAIAVMSLYNGESYYDVTTDQTSIQFVRFEASTQAWSALSVIQIDGIDIKPGVVSVVGDSAGNAWATWYRYSSMVGRYFDSKQKLWLDQVTVVDRSNSSDTQVASYIHMAEQGGVMLADVSERILVSNATYYSAAGGGKWQRNSILEEKASPSYTINKVLLSADAQGNFMAVWGWYDYTRPIEEDRAIKVAYFDKNTNTWGNQQVLVPYLVGLQLAKHDRAGNVFIAWTRTTSLDSTGKEVKELQVVRFDAKTKTWTNPTTLDSSIGTLPSESSYFTDQYDRIDFDFDRCGNAVFAWRKILSGDNTTRPVFSIQSSRYNISSNTISAPATLATNALQAEALKVLVPRNGKPVATWLQSDNGLTRAYSAVARQ